MAIITWNNVGERRFEVGVDHGILFTDYLNGVAWNGLISVTEKPSGGEGVSYYMDGIKYLNVSAPEDLTIGIEAYTYPDEFAHCDGTVFENGLGYTMQGRRQFHLVYRTRIGNDVLGSDRGYKLHFIYNALATPSEKAYSTQNASAETSTFTWDATTTPIAIPGRRPTSHLIIDSTKVTPRHLVELEAIIHGTITTSPRMPTPQDLIDLFGVEFFDIQSNQVSGLAVLTPDEETPEVQGNPSEGLYSDSTSPSMTETETPGLYVQEA